MTKLKVTSIIILAILELSRKVGNPITSFTSLVELVMILLTGMLAIPLLVTAPVSLVFTTPLFLVIVPFVVASMAMLLEQLVESWWVEQMVARAHHTDQGNCL